MYELVSPVRPKVLLRYLSRLIIGSGFVLLAPLIAALFYGEVTVFAIYILIVAAIMIFGLAVSRILPDEELERKEAVLLAAFIFPFLAAVCTLPISFLTDMTLLDAFFEAVSGVTTTGLSVSPSDAGPVFLFTRSWLQWTGGIGILIIAMLIFASPGASAYRLYSVNISEEKIRPTVYATAKTILTIYCALTITAFILLILGGMSVFDSLCHAMSSVSTGGFSTSENSISGFSGIFLPFIITLSCIMGAMNFSLYSLSPGNIRAFISDIQTKYFFAAALLGFVILFFTIYDSSFFQESISISLFQAFSALTTSGFSTVDLSLLTDASKAVLTVLMWTGGCVGSTAGGIKIIRLIILLKIIHIVFIRFFLPREALTPLKAGKEVIESDIVYSTITYVLLYFSAILISCFIFIIYGFEPGSALFEVSSAIGTVGLSCGITDAALPSELKIVLIVDMLLGRIEIIPLVILLYPRTWIKRRGRI
ncbi:MAG: TrkH family potassium uptake protein [Methanomicrobium sp.]|nr:TrkH family potassium uptake protein [Methanomicrobium sp.]